ncbi:MAG: prepilin-type N-terminal cleavage/methylation domain-containing protein [Gemmatimonadota bacterium]|nr:prepilin-type N-terminal cleavage/methylation domain-containing protein [Gemmatimonadota bacterium]
MRSRARTCRPGFTLVELLVALVVFDVALLAFAADAASLVRLRGSAARQEAAVRAAQSRLAGLRAQPCPAPSNGTGTPLPGVREFWSVTAAPGSARDLRDSVVFDGPRPAPAFVLRSAVDC